MSNALRALLDRIVDYAGIFPPARLPLDQAARRYAAALASPDAWIVGRFICPAERLSELAELCAGDGLGARGGADREAPGGRAEGVWHVIALGRGGADEAAFSAGLAADARAVRELHASRSPGAARLRVDALETRLPPSVARSGSAGVVGEQIAGALRRIAADGPPTPIQVYFEGSLGGEWRRNIEAVIAAVGAHNARAQGAARAAWETIAGAAAPGAGSDARDAPAVGVKLRTGGVEASAFPTSEQVAHFVASCARHQVAWKATAGLHHPLRHFNEGAGCRMHGFVNLFAGAALLLGGAAERGGSTDAPFEEVALRAVLEDESADALRFDERGMSWRGKRVTIDAIRDARRRFAISFGSCSIDEPLEDLERLGWATG